MKTQNYNPSPLERSIAEAILGSKEAIQQKLSEAKIINVRAKIETDNPLLHFDVEDSDGDLHEIVVRIIQRIDEPDS